jgi:hypothetical protein
MNTLQKLIVISEAGRLIGTQVLRERPEQEPGVTAVLSPGPGQERHYLELEVPARFGSADEIHAFHAMVAARLGLRGP